jgi:hypothetical protein
MRGTSQEAGKYPERVRESCAGCPRRFNTGESSTPRRGSPLRRECDSLRRGQTCFDEGDQEIHGIGGLRGHASGSTGAGAHPLQARQHKSCD